MSGVYPPRGVPLTGQPPPLSREWFLAPCRIPTNRTRTIPSMSPLDIRAYRPADRDAVRRICCDTADAGRPLESMLGESRPIPAVRDLWADVLTAAYTDHAPRLVWVATRGEEVVGYLAGCLDETRQRRVLTLRVLPVALARAFLRGALFRRSLLRFAWANRRCPGRPPRLPYGAHLHVNLSPAARGGGAGRALVERFLETAREAGAAGVTASVAEDNASGRAFFERLGFAPMARHRLFFLPSGETRFAVIHGRAS